MRNKLKRQSPNLSKLDERVADVEAKIDETKQLEFTCLLKELTEKLTRDAKTLKLGDQSIFIDKIKDISCLIEDFVNSAKGKLRASYSDVDKVSCDVFGEPVDNLQAIYNKFTSMKAKCASEVTLLDRINEDFANIMKEINRFSAKFEGLTLLQEEVSKVKSKLADVIGKIEKENRDATYYETNQRLTSEDK